MQEELKTIFEYIPNLTWPATAVLIMFFLYKAGLLGALTSWVQRPAESAIAKDYKQFKLKAETNHYHDLSELLKSNARLWKIIEDMRHDISILQQDVAFMKGKLNGK